MTGKTIVDAGSVGRTGREAEAAGPGGRGGGGARRRRRGGRMELLSPATKTYTLQSWTRRRCDRQPRAVHAGERTAAPVQMSLASPETGYAAKLYVAEGDAVKKGEVLARLEVPDLKNDLEDLQASLAEAQRSFQKTVATNGVDLDRKAREIAALETDIADARAEVARMEQLVAVNGARQSELETAMKSLATLEGSKTEKELQLAEQKRLDALDEQSAQTMPVLSLPSFVRIALQEGFRSGKEMIRRRYDTGGDDQCKGLFHGHADLDQFIPGHHDEETRRRRQRERDEDADAGGNPGSSGFLHWGFR